MAKELVVLVDNNGNRIGTADKLRSHHANTPLHLAFSCYVFNDKGELLVTRRALSKKVYPGVWTNTACGHPGPHETTRSAIKRRLLHELGMRIHNLQVILPNYRYKSPPQNGIIENEICPVYMARSSDQPQLNPAEVEDYTWMPWQDYIAALEADNEGVYSWWSQDQLKQLKNNDTLLKYIKG
jgi:isopentenyl-diphosphate delta-isomerase